MNITDLTTATQLVRALTATMPKPPKVVIAAYERATRLSEAARNLSAGDDALATTVTAALEADRDPAGDPEVQRVLAASQIANPGIMQAVDAIAYDQFRTVCTEHADAIVAAWSAPFDTAATTLTRCHQRIGSVPLEDTASIMRRGDDIAAVWADAQAATATIDTIQGGWSALGEFTRTARPDRRYSVLRIADVDLDTLQRQQLEGRKVTPWEAVVAGLTLSLPTAVEYRQRVRNIEAARQNAQQLAEQAAHDQATGRLLGAPVAS